jgi:hypothetical protein
MPVPTVDSGPAEAPETPLPPARAGRFNVSLGVDSIWYTKPSFDLFSDTDVAHAFDVSVGYAVWVDGALSLVPELGWNTNSQSASGLFSGGLTSTSLDANTFYAGASLRYDLLGFIEPEARVTGGFTLLDATIDQSAGPSPLESKATSPFLSLGAGFTLHTPTGMLRTNQGSLGSLILGVTVEGGYTIAKSMDLDPTPQHPSGRIATTDMGLGTLARSGPYVRTALSVRF